MLRADQNVLTTQLCRSKIPLETKNSDLRMPILPPSFFVLPKMSEGSNKLDPNRITLTSREQVEWSGWIDGLKSHERAFLEEAGAKYDGYDACPPRPSRIQKRRQLVRSNKGSSQKIRTDQYNCDLSRGKGCGKF